MLPAFGLERNYWYMWDDREFVGLYLVEADRTNRDPGCVRVRATRNAGSRVHRSSSAGTAAAASGPASCSKEGHVVTVAWKLGAVGSYTIPEGTTIAYPFTREPVAAEGGATVELGELPVLYSPVEIPSLVG